MDTFIAGFLVGTVVTLAEVGGLYYVYTKYVKGKTL